MEIAVESSCRLCSLFKLIFCCVDSRCALTYVYPHTLCGVHYVGHVLLNVVVHKKRGWIGMCSVCNAICMNLVCDISYTAHEIVRHLQCIMHTNIDAEI